MRARVLFALLACGTAVGAPLPIELKAEEWLNPMVIRVPENRTYVVLFFSALEDKGVDNLIRDLNRLAKKKHVAVIGLSPAPAARVEKFIKEHRIRFPVGARSSAHRRFKVDRFPTVVRIEPNSLDSVAEGWEILTSDKLADLAPADDEQAIPLPPSPLDDSTPLSDVQLYARRGTDVEQRHQAFDLLRRRMEYEEFVRFTDDLLGDEELSTTDRGELAYQRHLADPMAPVKQPRFPASSLAEQRMRADPDGALWERARKYNETIERLPPQQLFDDFFGHLTDQDVDLVIRKEIAREFSKVGDEGDAAAKATGRSLLMQMLPAEPDPGVRLFLLLGLWSACEPGDIEAADFLDHYAKTESDVRLVRPTLEVVTRCLRTGDGPCYNDPEN